RRLPVPPCGAGRPAPPARATRGCRRGVSTSDRAHGERTGAGLSDGTIEPPRRELTAPGAAGRHTGTDGHHTGDLRDPPNCNDLVSRRTVLVIFPSGRGFHPSLDTTRGLGSTVPVELPLAAAARMEEDHQCGDSLRSWRRSHSSSARAHPARR